jgi:hypothetical protein
MFFQEPSWYDLQVIFLAHFILYSVVIQIGEHNRIISKQNIWVYKMSNMLVLIQNGIVVLVHLSKCDLFVYH